MYSRDIIDVNNLASPLLANVNRSIRHHERRIKQLEKLRDALISIAHNDLPIGETDGEQEQAENGGDPLMTAIARLSREDDMQYKPNAKEV